MSSIISSHLRNFLDVPTLREKVGIARRILRDHDFDTIAFRGMSGALIAPALALELQKNLIMVRKPSDKGHSCFKVEGNQDAKRYIIVDDFESSGDTKRIIIEAVRDFAPDANYLGFLGCAYLNSSDIRLCHGQVYPLS